MGVGHTDDKSAQHLSQKTTHKFCLVLRTGFEPLVFRSGVDALPTEPPPSPLNNLTMHTDENDAAHES